MLRVMKRRFPGDLRNGFRFCLLLFGLLIWTHSGEGCSLAQHDWQLMADVPLAWTCPLTLWPHLDFLENQLQGDLPEAVLWVVERPREAVPALVSLWFMPWKVKGLPWNVVGRGTDVLDRSRQAAAEGVRSLLVLGTDKVRLRLLWWSDRNAGYQCHQLVFLQEGRLRAISTSTTNPLAVERSQRFWVSVIFYRLPVPGLVLSVAVFPWHGIRASLWEDYELVEELLRHGRLKWRPDSQPDPYMDDFPDVDPSRAAP